VQAKIRIVGNYFYRKKGLFFSPGLDLKMFDSPPIVSSMDREPEKFHGENLGSLNTNAQCDIRLAFG
jgi:hypothetical protein